MFTHNIQKRCKGMLLKVGWLLAMFTSPAAVWAGCTDSVNQNYNILIDASSSCEASSSNMAGCTTDSSGSCVIVNPDGSGEEIHIQLLSGGVGQVPVAPDLVSWEVTSTPERLIGKSVDILIEVGAAGGGSCSWDLFPGKDNDSGAAFQKTNGSYQKTNGIFFCSDFAAPPPADAIFTINKTVMISGGTCGVDDVEVLETDAGAEVEYCVVVKNVGPGQASGVVLTDPDAGIDQSLGTIDGGAPPQTIQSDPITISDAGQIINTATVTWTNAEDPALSEDQASDTAKVIAEQALVLCPAEYQALINDLATAGDGFTWAALLDSENPELASICVPTEGAATGEATRIECVLECVSNPAYPDCIVPGEVCEPCLSSGAWGDGTENCPNDAPAGTVPYCWEVNLDHDQNCTYEPVESLTTYEFSIQLIHRNPFCYNSCTGTGKKRRCEEICF